MPNTSADLANAVSAYATILSGIIPLLLCWLVSPQPRRWLFVYLCIFITGVPTVWMHGFGEQFPARVADIGTNLLLAWALQIRHPRRLFFQAHATHHYSHHRHRHHRVHHATDRIGTRTPVGNYVRAIRRVYVGRAVADRQFNSRRRTVVRAQVDDAG